MLGAWWVDSSMKIQIHTGLVDESAKTQIAGLVDESPEKMETLMCYEQSHDVE